MYRCYPSADLVQNVTQVEIGPGRGDFLFEIARSNPEKLIAAVEIKLKRFEKLIPRIERHGLKNILLIQGDGRVVLPSLFGKEQLEAVYILFSDPWPKRRHAKHRLFQRYFICELRRVLKVGGEILLAHDDENYFGEIQRLFSEDPGFIQCHDDGPGLNLFQTFYAEKWKAEGRKLIQATFRKKNY